MIIAIDFDGTCVTHEFPNIGRELPGCIETLKRLNEAGHILVLYSCRINAYLYEARAWLEERGVKIEAANMEADGTGARGKILYDLLIDDRALGCPLEYDAVECSLSADWRKIAKKLEEYGVLPAGEN